MKRQTDQKSSIFINPRGFIDQVYYDTQTPDSVLQALKQLEQRAQKMKAAKKPVLIFIDTSQLTKIDLSARMLHVRTAALQAMQNIEFKKAAVCAPLPIQILVNTMALVAGKRNKVKVFENRAAAIKWLIGK